MIRKLKDDDFINFLQQRKFEELYKLLSLQEESNQRSLVTTNNSSKHEVRILQENIAAYERVLQIELEKQSLCRRVENAANIADYPAWGNFSTSDRPTTPRKMSRLRFKGMTLNQIILTILKEYDRPLHVKEIAQIAYKTNTKAEFRRVSDSIGTTRRIGAKAKLWQKIAHGLYTAK